MRPLSSPARENRFLGLVEIGIGFFFAVAAGVLNPIEAAVGVVAGTLIVGSVMSVLRIRRAARATHAARPAPTDEREELGVFPRRIAWPVAGQLAVCLAIVAAARSPGLIAGIAFGVGIALIVTARWLERWEDAHKISLLHERGRKGFYVAHPER
ncbi:MAG: hypothetical protein QOH72_5377 [Solirubrobacteraceae bacterium]|jgi:hypothetical protein|nr:hypothetical protein [Solirubrobacteraceae bacterium]